MPKNSRQTHKLDKPQYVAMPCIVYMPKTEH